MARYSTTAPTPENKTALYAAVGRALTQWNLLEDALCLLLCTAVNDRNHTPCDVVYWSIASFEARLSMTSAAVNRIGVYWPETIACWQALEKHVRKRASRRNAIAHGSVVHLTWTNKGMTETYQDVFLAPYWHAHQARDTDRFSRGGDMRPKDRLSEKQITQISEMFRSLANRVWALRNDLSDKLRDRDP